MVVQGAASAKDLRPPPPSGSHSKVTEFEWSCKVSMLEIYNEEVRCLLSPPPKKGESHTKLDIKLGKDGLMNVPGLESEDVASTAEVLSAFEVGTGVGCFLAVNSFGRACSLLLK